MDSDPLSSGSLRSDTTTHTPSTSGPAPLGDPDDADDATLDDREQLRFAVVLNGGVSLAIWMGGATHEIDRLTKAVAPRSGAPVDPGIAVVPRSRAYEDLLRWVNCVARVDVISGTSAGGINGAALALSQCNALSQGMGLLRDVWLESGSITRLLRQPFKGSPPSLLQGDEFFLPQLNRAMRRLAEPYRAKPLDLAPMDLTITATLLRGIPGVSIDQSGQRIAENRHDGLFRFQRELGGPLAGQDLRDDFATEAVAAERGEGPLDALALAARTTASFPVAFEASYLPARPEDAEAMRGGLHPDMAPYLSGAWDQSQDGIKHSRFAVDGGVLANTPTRPALEAIDRMPADGPVRRVMLMVHPHAAQPGRDSHDLPAQGPTLARTSGGILGALTSEGSRSYTHLIEEHNRLAQSRRDLRAEVVKVASEQSTEDLAEQARSGYTWYVKVRARRVARTLTEIWLGRPQPEDAEPESFAQVFGLILDHIEEPLAVPLVNGDIPDPHMLGYEGALGVADAAVDFLRRALKTRVSSAATRAAISRARGVVSAQRNAILARRAEFVAEIAEKSVTSDSLDSWVADVERRWETVVAGDSLREPLARIAESLASLHMRRDEMTVRAGVTMEGAGALAAFADALDITRDGKQGTAATDRVVGGASTGAAVPREVLQRLNRIQVLTFVVSDEVRTGSSLPLELIQLTYQVEHPFAPGMTGEEKVAGDMLSRFSAFLKRSWRVNDWTWGRLDGARVLCQTVLEPSRVAQFIAIERNDGESFEQAVARLVDQARGDLPPLPGVPSRAELIAELLPLESDLDASMLKPLVALPSLFAARLALEIAAEELPVIVRAVDADGREGANVRARGAVNVKANEDLLLAAPKADDAGRWRALEAFAASGIGVEAINAEATSDQLIGTAATAAATAVTVLDGEQSGLGFLKPVTRTLRGGALLPYWAVTGLTSGGAVAKGLALLALSTGAVLFALGMLSIGPRWGVAVGAGAVLGAFAYGALRSGTVLHSVVLLLPSVGLLAWAAQQMQPVPSAAASAAQPAQPTGILLAIVLLVIGLLILGNLRPPVRSPLAVFTKYSRVGVIVIVLLVVLVLLALPSVRGVVVLIADELREAGAQTFTPDALRILGIMAAVLGVIYVLVGARFAYRAGANWRLVTLAEQDPPTTTRAWQQLDVEHPAGTTAGWSFVYGFLSLVLAVGFAIAVWSETWAGSAGVTSVIIAFGVGAALLILPVPAYVHGRATRRLHAQASDVLQRFDDATPDDQRVAALFAGGLNYAYLITVTKPTVADDEQWSGVALSKHGQYAWKASRQG